MKPLSVQRFEGHLGYHERSRPDILRLATELGLRGVVCDFGCGAGVLGAALLEQGLASSVIGIEREPHVAEVARERLTQVITSNVTDAVSQVPRQFDAAIFADILEHLEDPVVLLRSVVELLSPEGKVIVSVPNVRHLRIALPLLFRNEWKYTDEGICDRTHLRFFTSQSAERLVRESGLVPVSVYGTVTGRGGRLCRVAPFVTSLVSTQILLGCTKQRVSMEETQ